MMPAYDKAHDPPMATLTDGPKTTAVHDEHLVRDKFRVVQGRQGRAADRSKPRPASQDLTRVTASRGGPA